MFSIIQRGQMYADGAGFPVTIQACSDSIVIYRRQDGGFRSVDIAEFNRDFERLDYQEYKQIKDECERSDNIKNLRNQIRRANRQNTE
ncbi:DUF4222 domain-containing protein [Salmonella enterica]|uniref:DUF4222 domain-containing protein n=1 Tax=Salmonella enterica TaxID=28901 RepID=UPI003D1710BD